MQRRVATLVAATAGEQHDAVGFASVAGPFAEDFARVRRLQRGECEPPLRIVRRDEADRAVAQVADAVEEDDGRRRGGPYFFANESLVSDAVKCVLVVTYCSGDGEWRERA